MPRKPGESLVFVGVRSRGDARVWVQTKSSMFPLRLYTNVRNHSPNGFEWGYGGSGPAQLALAMCLEVLAGEPDGERRALECYQDVKWRFVGRLEAETWELRGEEVREYIRTLEARYPEQEELRRAMAEEAAKREELPPMNVIPLEVRDGHIEHAELPPDVARGVGAYLEADAALEAAEGELTREEEELRRQGPHPETGE